MKKRTKILAVVLSCAAILGGTVFGSMAYLKDQDVVTNTFTVGQVDISLDEALTNDAGEKLAADKTTVYTDPAAQTLADRVKANTYKLIPGHTYVKDPTVHVAAGSETCYVFVKVENGLAKSDKKTIEADHDAAVGGYKSVNSQINNNHWIGLYYNVTDTADPTHITKKHSSGVYYKLVSAEDAKKGIDLQVFSCFKIKDGATAAELEDYEDSTIKVTAYAIQADGFINAPQAAQQFNLLPDDADGDQSNF